MSVSQDSIGLRSATGLFSALRGLCPPGSLTWGLWSLPPYPARAVDVGGVHGPDASSAA